MYFRMTSNFVENFKLPRFDRCFFFVCFFFFNKMLRSLYLANAIYFFFQHFITYEFKKWLELLTFALLL